MVLAPAVGHGVGLAGVASASGVGSALDSFFHALGPVLIVGHSVDSIVGEQQ